MAVFHDLTTKTFSKLPAGNGQGSIELINCVDSIELSDGVIMDLLDAGVQKTLGGLGNCIIDDAQKKV